MNKVTDIRQYGERGYEWVVHYPGGHEMSFRTNKDGEGLWGAAGFPWFPLRTYDEFRAHFENLDLARKWLDKVHSDRRNVVWVSEDRSNEIREVLSDRNPVWSLWVSEEEYALFDVPQFGPVGRISNPRATQHFFYRDLAEGRDHLLQEVGSLLWSTTDDTPIMLTPALGAVTAKGGDDWYVVYRYGDVYAFTLCADMDEAHEMVSNWMKGEVGDD